MPNNNLAAEREREEKAIKEDNIDLNDSPNIAVSTKARREGLIVY
jgi:hypothetical protein